MRVGYKLLFTLLESDDVEKMGMCQINHIAKNQSNFQGALVQQACAKVGKNSAR